MQRERKLTQGQGGEQTGGAYRVSQAELVSPALGPDSSLLWKCGALTTWGRTSEHQHEKPPCVLKQKPSFNHNSKHGVEADEKQGLVTVTFLEASPGAYSPASHTGLTTAIQLSPHPLSRSKILNL